MIKNINDKTFDNEILQSERPVLVDFFAQWCAPCKMLAPILEQLSEDKIAKKVDFAKLDVEESPTIAQHYGIMSVPTMILFKNGEELVRLSGVHPMDAIAGTIAGYVDRV